MTVQSEQAVSFEVEGKFNDIKCFASYCWGPDTPARCLPKLLVEPILGLLCEIIRKADIEGVTAEAVFQAGVDLCETDRLRVASGYLSELTRKGETNTAWKPKVWFIPVKKEVE